MSEYTLYHGDCLNILPTLAPQSIDAVIADIPSGRTACAWDSVISFAPMWESLKRLVKPRGAIVLLGCTQPFTSALVMSNVEMFKYDWVWHKNRPSDKFNAKNKPMSAHESICVFSSGTTANCSDKKMIYFPQGLIASGKEVRGTTGQRHHGIRPSHKEKYILEFTGYPNTYLYFPKDDIETIHPTQKPLALLEYLVKTYTNPGDTVLDFTMGSGTTGAACGNLGRRFVGIEQDAGYFAIAQERIATAYEPLRAMQVAV